MWIFCCGMQRSGSTLQFQITAQLVEEAGLGKRVGWVHPDRFPALREEHARYHGWKVYKVHVCTDAMAAEFQSGNAMGVYSFRDLRDVYVSRMKKYSLTFDDMWVEGFVDQSLDDYRRWTRLPRVLVSRYEDIASDVAGEVQRIATHLGIAIDRPRAEQIAAEYTVDKQNRRVQEAERAARLQQSFVNGPLYDPDSLLHRGHIQSGAIGDWKRVLSDEQVAAIEGGAGAWLVEHGYQLSLGRSERTRLGFWLVQKANARRAQRRASRALNAVRQRIGL